MAHHHDYIIIGLGCAGSHLLHALLEVDPQADILVIESQKKPIDKTWCFWEQGSGKWDSLIDNQWSQGQFFGLGKKKHLDLKEYRYKLMESERFIAFAKAKIQSANNVSIIYQSVDQVKTLSDGCAVYAENEVLAEAKYVFDSRSEVGIKPTEPSLIQHFKGWFVETQKASFETEVFTMMDYRLKKEGTTSFMYVLPLSQKRALIEFTYFTPDVEDDPNYEIYNEQYLKEFLGVADFKIYKTEHGRLPMNCYDYSQADSEFHIHIGTAGGWLKPSSGYSFKNAERYAHEIANHLNRGKSLQGYSASGRFSLYDATFLKALAEHNDRGEKLFYKLYGRNDITQVFKFLDEQTSIPEELRIMASLTGGLMVRSFFETVI